RLDLARNYLGDDAALALAGSPHVGRLRELALSSNGLTSVAARALAESTSLGALEVLSLHDNSLGHRGVDALAQGRGLPALRALGLTGNSVGTGHREQFESGSEAAGDYYSGSYEVQETREQLAARFVHRSGLVIS